MRGEHALRQFGDTGGRGIIPACAGSTGILTGDSKMGKGSSPHARGARVFLRICRRSCRDHPRMRGEHRDLALRHGVAKRIIPACAGSTYGWSIDEFISIGSSPHTRGAPCPLTSSCARTWDHPRIRGEHLLEVLLDVEDVGIIPAYAGST